MDIQDNYSDKNILIVFKIKTVLPFPLSDIQLGYSISASIGEGKLTKKHVTNLMHFHFAPVSNVTFITKHAA